MIEFTKIVVKNFGSYGNTPTTIDLNKVDNTLVVGKNGKGKSTILLDGVFFVLFNKPYRKVTKTQLINSINKSGTLVEIYFTTRGSDYKVVRGIKPNIFAIEKDGEVLDTNVLSKDLQEYLEQDILQLNIRTFSQTVVLGSTSYIPFMQLDASKRREVVDDVLDVWVYTRMAENAKEDLSLTNRELNDVSHRYDLTKAEAVSIHKLLGVMKENKDGALLQMRQDRQALVDLKAVEEDNCSTFVAEISKLKSLLHPLDGLSETKSRHQGIVKNIGSLETKIKDIENLTTCPTCLQKVGDEHKHAFNDKVLVKLDDLKTQRDQLQTELDHFYTAEKENHSIQLQIDELEGNLKKSRWSISSIEKDIANIDARIKEATTNNNDKIEEETRRLKELIAENKTLSKKIDELREKKAILELSVKLLKDSGIKAAIVKEYLPVLNSLINEYLSAYNFDINIELDQTFSEKINSRGRENFSYHSFSEGEKEKIDYAIMLALRKIAASKNASNINILILDEILDGSLDEESRSATLSLLTDGNEKSNIFVISHTESNPGYYDRILKVDKRGDFSFITEEI